MKYIWIVFLALIFCNCNSANQESTTDSTSRVADPDSLTGSKNVWVNRYNGKTYPLPDTIGNKPANFYLENPKVESLAKAFYLGRFTPSDSDNDSTTELLSYVTTNDSIIRPFYRW